MYLLSVIMLAFVLFSQLKYTKEGKDNLQNFGVVTDTPVYITAVQSGINASEVSHSLLVCTHADSLLFFFSLRSTDS